MAAMESEDFEPSAKPPSGVIIPPPELRKLLEKTAGYIARNGPAFEARVLEKSGSNPKVAFLNPSDPYHAYYRWRVSEIKDGRGSALAAGREGEAASASAAQKRKGPEPPPEFHFSARMPNISAQDLDILRLTAMFVAKNGRSFLTQLSQRESGNFQFDFLRPQHSLNQYFSRLIDQYSDLLKMKTSEEGQALEKQRMDELDHNIDNKYHLLGRAKTRAEYTKYEEKQQAKKEEAAEAEQLAYASIDWHDFNVVETILFTDDDAQEEIGVATSISELQSASLEQKAQRGLAPGDRRIEEAFPMEADFHSHTSLQNMPNRPPSQVNGSGPPNVPSPGPAANHFPPPPLPSTNSPVPVQGSGYPPPNITPLEFDRTATPEGSSNAQAAARANANTAPLNIRTDYQPRSAAARRNQTMSICPRCKQQIPSNEIAEHMRIELLDPRWKEQRDKAEARYATTNLTPADMANNLKRLASQRSDMFDGVTGEILTEEEKERRKRAARGYDGVIPGLVGHGPLGGKGAQGAKGHAGNSGTGQEYDPTVYNARNQQMQNMNLEEQLRHIRQKAQGEGS